MEDMEDMKYHLFPRSSAGISMKKQKMRRRRVEGSSDPLLNEGRKVYRIKLSDCPMYDENAAYHLFVGLLEPVVGSRDKAEKLITENYCAVSQFCAMLTPEEAKKVYEDNGIVENIFIHKDLELVWEC